MAVQNDNTILNKGDLKAYHERILPYLGGNMMVSTNNSDYYSTDEKVVGVWTDGKPLYQKTIYVSSGFTNPTNLDSSLNTTDVNIISLEGSVKMGNRYVVFLNRANIQSINFQMEVYSSDTGLLFYYGSSISDINWVSVTVKYTKTTDVAGSATTTPGAYDINFPNTWKANTEIYFGNGLYGYRKTGNFSATPTGSRWDTNVVPLNMSTGKIIGSGGSFRIIDLNNLQAMAAMGNNVVNADGTQLFSSYFYGRSNGNIIFQVYVSGGIALRNTDTYDIWVTYTK